MHTKPTKHKAVSSRQMSTEIMFETIDYVIICLNLVVFRCLRSVLVTSVTGCLQMSKICVGDLNDWLSSDV